MYYILERARMGAYKVPDNLDIQKYDLLLFWNNLFLTKEIEYNIIDNLIIILAAERAGSPKDLVTLFVIPNYSSELARLEEYDKSTEWYKLLINENTVITEVPVDRKKIDIENESS